MAAPQTREPAGAPQAQPAGSRHHQPNLGTLITTAIVWLILTGAAALVAAMSAYRGQDPTVYLAVLFAGWLLITPWVMPSMQHRPPEEDGR